jgi:predicted transcriptional regulator
MKIKRLVRLIRGKVIKGNDLTEKMDIKHAFAADLMSDVLALVSGDNKNTILITGITNPQIIRTAEMLDVPAVIVARGKEIPNETIKLAEETHITIIGTKYIVFVTSGILYKYGISGVKIRRSDGKKSSPNR